MGKAARRAGWALVERVSKTGPQGRRFLPLSRYIDYHLRGLAAEFGLGPVRRRSVGTSGMLRNESIV